MKIIRKSISITELKNMASQTFGNLIKAVVDVEKRIMTVGGELHADEESLLLKNGSKQKNLWGISLYPDLPKKEMIEFDSMINLRPSQGNKTRGVDNSKIKAKIIEIVNALVIK